MAGGAPCTDDGNPCSLDQCNGVAVTCQHPAGHAGTVCRASAGVCDLPEACSGSSTACPVDTKSGAVCRAAAGPCDVAERCSGADTCPSDDFVAGGTPCRSPFCQDGVLNLADRCDGLGSCGDGGVLDCRPYACNEVTNACDSSCSGDSQCGVDHECVAGACKLVEGQPCGAGGACASGWCIDGVCCDGECAGECQACNLPGFVGACSPVEAGTDPDNDCDVTDPAVCGDNGVCDGAGQCQLYVAGTVCHDAFCVDSDSHSTDRCDGLGTCVDGGVVNCPPYSCNGETGVCRLSCSLPGDCSAGNECSDGHCMKSLGTSCAVDAECAGGQCADGVCCSAPCDGACERCDAAGTCLAIDSGTDPDNECAAESAETCGLTGACSGARSCALYAASTPCSQAVCDAGVLNLIDRCDGVGHCVDQGLEACAPYACEAGACRLSCLSSAQCQSGYECFDGECIGSLGTSCVLDGECASGFCADGTCCDAACDGTCESCALGGYEGTCTAIAAGTDPGGECAATAATSCGTTGACSGERACELFPATTVCRPSAGACDVLELCDGAGSCPADGKSTAPCRAAAGACDVAESCDGVGDACPADGFRLATVRCRDTVDLCDVAEYCTGSGPTCPDDGFAPPVVVCRDSVGTCDLTDVCTGESARCPQDAKSTAMCRPDAGPCDAAEFCSGLADDCPADGFLPSTVVCRASIGECDQSEYCAGDAAACPGDARLPVATPCSDDGNACTIDQCDGVQAVCPRTPAPEGVVCRPASDTCDVSEACDGVATSCPDDLVRPDGQPCPDDGETCTADRCDGAGKTCTHPAGNLGVECRAAAGSCDVGEGCDGASPTCPSDALQPAGAVCRAAAGECDVVETCTGASAACPAETFKAAGTGCTDDGSVCSTDLCTGASAECRHAPGNAGSLCRAAVGDCDVAEACDGSGVLCPADAFVPSTVVCRVAIDGCDHAETCPGDAGFCPSDIVLAIGEPCPDDDNTCTVESCDGVTTACHHQPGNAGAICRAAVGECDVVETCTGTTAACPDDAIFAPDAPCTDDGETCTSDTCDGATTVCHHQPGNAGVVCRKDAGLCDVQEACDGVVGTCPADRLLPADTICRPSEGVCDLVEVCSGHAPSCPGDRRKDEDTPCADDGNPCTEDICDGSTVTCQHPIGNAGNICRAIAGACDVVETCTGSSDQCPTDAYRPAGADCRPAAGECDVPEFCVGDTADCPVDVFSPQGAPCNENDSSCDGSGQCVGAPVAYNSGLYLPPRVAADGHALALAVVTLRNASGQLVANKRVQFSAIGAEVFDPTNLSALVRTNYFGQAAVFVRSAQVGKARVIASWAAGLESVSGTMDFVPPEPTNSKVIPTPGGDVQIIVNTVGAALTDAHEYEEDHLPAGLTPGAAMPLGMRAATIRLYPGQAEVSVTVLMPMIIAPSHRLWMFGPTADDRRPHWVDVTYSPYVTGLKDEDATYTVQLVDGGFGDADGVVNGVIVDPQGITQNPAEIPTLDQWAMILLALALAALAVRRLRVASSR